MRKFEAIIGAAIWIAVATLMPMSALQPVDGSAAQAAKPIHALASPCRDGSPRLAMGCVDIFL